MQDFLVIQTVTVNKLKFIRNKGTYGTTCHGHQARHLAGDTKWDTISRTQDPAPDQRHQMGHQITDTISQALDRQQARHLARGTIYQVYRLQHYINDNSHENSQDTRDDTGPAIPDRTP